MFLTVFRDDIIEGLAKSANIIPAKTGAAFLRTIWLKAENNSVQIMSTDSNLEFCGQYKAEVKDEGLTGVQGRAFYDLIRKLPPGEISMEMDEEKQQLIIKQGKRRYRLPVSEPGWFQEFSDFPEKDAVVWSGDFIQDLIDATAYCISNEDAMEAITCMNFASSASSEHIEVCGLNGHQFALTRFLHDDLRHMLPEAGILIQKKYLLELKKWLAGDEVELNIDEKRLYVRTADKTELFSLPLSFYQYPDYNMFMSKIYGEGTSELLLDKNSMIEALDRISIFNTDSNRCTYFQIKEKELLLRCEGHDVGAASESLEIDYKGDLDKIAFPTKNLIEILSHFQSENITFIFTGSEGPCCITGDKDSEYKVIIMPMKISDEIYFSEEEN